MAESWTPTEEGLKFAKDLLRLGRGGGWSTIYSKASIKPETWTTESETGEQQAGQAAGSAWV